MAEYEDHVSAVLDEIALEGLDGITLEGLWVRLAERPYFQDTIDNFVKKYVWSIIQCLEGIMMYALPEARKPLTIFNRYDYVDPELGMVLEPDTMPEDIYPHEPVDDPSKQARGSCKTYKLRVNVTEEALKLTVEEVFEKWGSAFVMVASQTSRELALLGPDADPELELTQIQYCILERIGRSRYLGEVTQGKVSLQTVIEDPKAIFYHRKFLISHGLVLKQIHHQKTGTQNCSGSLLHLPRFYVERRQKVLYLTERVVEILKSRENYIAEYEEIRKELALTSSLRKLFQTGYFQRFVRTDLRLPYRELYPDAKVSEWKLKGRDKEKLIRVLQLIDPNTDVTAVSSKDDDMDLGEEDDTIDNLGPVEDFKVAMNKCYLGQVHECVENSGKDGLSQMEISAKLGLPKLNARTVSRNLLRRGLASIFMNDVGRQRVTRFRAKVFGRKQDYLNEVSKKEFEEQNEDMDVNAFMLAKNARTDEETTPIALEGEALDINSLNKERNMSKKRPINSSDKESVRKRLKLENDENNPTSLYETSKGLDDSMECETEEGNNTSLCTEQSESVSPSKEQTRSASASPVTVSSASSQSLFSCTEDDSYDATETGYNIITEKLHSRSMKTFYAHQVKDSPSMTYRIYKRINLILEYVKVHKVIDDYSKLVKLINTEEEKEGSVMKIDRKSLFRLIFRLNEEGYLNVFTYLLTDGSKEKMFFFICEPSITMGHSIIQSGIEQAKMKMFIVNKEKIETIVKSREAEVEHQIGDGVDQLKSKSGKPKHQNFIYDKKIGRKYGLCPKFVRMRTLHQFLFYLIYDYQGKEDLDQNEVITRLSEKEVDIDDTLLSLMPKIYHEDISWKMFVPPLREHAGWPQGWTVMCDILLRLPLSIFIKIFNVCYVIQGLEEYLNHPLRKHFLVKHLPVSMRNGLFAARKYIFSIYEVLQRLCYIGLIQFGPQRLKEKDQVLLYLNRKASLLDTVTSKPGYHQISDGIYDERRYEFTLSADVHKYWYDMWNICLHTRLGGRMCVQGKDIILETLQTKPDMQNAIQPRQATEAIQLDNGDVSGDKKGAAGLDSALFSHLKRNWNWTNAHHSNTKEDPGAAKGIDKRRARLANVKCDPVVFNKYTVMVKKSISFLQSGKFFKSTKHDKKQTPLNGKSVTKKAIAVVKAASSSKKSNIVRHIHARKRTPRNRPYYDDVDMNALQLMSKLRVEWSPEEDNLLLICKVACMYLCPNVRQQIIGFNVVRDMLHEAIPRSMNKTSKACQRRILYVMKNLVTSNNVAMHLEEVKQDPVINKKFGNVLAELRSRTDSNAENLENAMNNQFRLLVAELKSKSDSLVSRCQVDCSTLPDTPELFMKKFKILKPKNSLKYRGQFKEVTNVSDIHCAILNSIIISSLCCPSDKASWAYQLFKIYQQYPDNMLRSAMAKIRSDQMISLKKSFVPLVQKTNYLPLSSSPYQLSASYLHIIQTKYQYAIFHESFLMAKKLLEYHQTTSGPGMEAIITNGGSAATLVELMYKEQIAFTTEIPEQVIILDPRISEIDETYARIVERYRDILQNYKPGSDYATSSALFKKHLGTLDSDESSESGANKETSDADLESDADIPEYPLVDVEFEESETPTPASSQQTAIARTASRIALFMMREEFEDTGVSANQHAHDFFVVNSCQVYCKLLDEEKDIDNTDKPEQEKEHKEVMPLSSTFISKLLDSLKKKIVVDASGVTEETVHEKFVELGASDAVWNQSLSIINYTQEKKELGATVKELRVNFQHTCQEMSLAQILGILVECTMLLRSGVTTMHYIHKNYARHWLVHTHKLVRLKREKLDPTNIQAISLGDENINDEGESNHEKTLSECDDNMQKPGIGFCIGSTTSSEETKNTEGVQSMEVDEVLDKSENKSSTSTGTTDNSTKDISNKPLESLCPKCKCSNGSSISSGMMLVKQGEVAGDSTAVCREVGAEPLGEHRVGDNIPIEVADHTSKEPRRSKRSHFKSCCKCGKKKATRNERVKGRKKTIVEADVMEKAVEEINFSDSDKLQITIRPWVRVNGSLNRRVLDRMLGAVLGHSMFKPGQTMKEFGQRFSPALQPFHVRELIEILQRLGCVRILVIRKSCKTNLFSKPSVVHLDPADGTEDENSIVIEPLPDAVLRLGQFIGNKAYSQDLLSC